MRLTYHYQVNGRYTILCYGLTFFENVNFIFAKTLIRFVSVYCCCCCCLYSTMYIKCFTHLNWFCTSLPRWIKVEKYKGIIPMNQVLSCKMWSLPLIPSIQSSDWSLEQRRNRKFLWFPLISILTGIINSFSLDAFLYPVPLMHHDPSLPCKTVSRPWSWIMVNWLTFPSYNKDLLLNPSNSFSLKGLCLLNTFIYNRQQQNTLMLIKVCLSWSIMFIFLAS